MAVVHAVSCPAATEDGSLWARCTCSQQTRQGGVRPRVDATDPVCPYPEHHPKCGLIFRFCVTDGTTNEMFHTFECERLKGHLARHKDETTAWRFEWDG